MEEEERFEAAGQDGTLYTVIVDAPVEELRTLSGPSTERRRLPTYRLLDGRVLTPVDGKENTFKILDDIGEILTRLES